MKLDPKVATFCPGCGHKNLELSKAPELIIKAEQKEPTKKITIFSSKKSKPKSTLF